VNGLPFILDRDKICKFIQWAGNIHVEEDGFQQIFNAIIKNSIVGLDNNEAKLFFHISLKCIQVIFMPNLLCLSFNYGKMNFKNLKLRVNGILKTI
jgi:hypothetical protein